ncbi:MAG TPA: glycosyltransferase, partial [Chthonomonadales bacterium]|nr:glycosyltransferase [Chthonomonadales bacterium]
ERPESGRLALMQPWEYGYLPQRWIQPLRDAVDEVWCYSNYVKQVYLDSGIEADKLHVTPLGVDVEVFRPEPPQHIFTDEVGAERIAGRRPFVFLFVGGTLHRKGIDVLLEAYRLAFTPLDDVCLVVKDTCTRTVYRGQNEEQRLRALAVDKTYPPLIYMDQDLSSHQLAGLYAAADCVALPYRGEGFCLPALEAMACGKPVIVPEGGPTDDFVDDTVGWRVAAERNPFGRGKIGELYCVGPTWLFEVEATGLARLMREIVGKREDAAKRGAAGRARAEAGWTWRQSTARILERLNALACGKPRGAAAVGEAGASRSAGATDGRPAWVKGARGKRMERARPKISLCMIARNEKRVIAECLKSIMPYVDEAIVVDTGSTDDTMEIARSLGARVYEFEWCDDFSAARNESLKYATGDWIFWMDADDTIPAECGERLSDLAFMAEDGTFGVIVQVRFVPRPGEYGTTVVDHIKLFRNLPEMRFEGRIHEQILGAIDRAGGTYARSDIYVEHSGYDYSPE